MLPIAAGKLVTQRVFQSIGQAFIDFDFQHHSDTLVADICKQSGWGIIVTQYWCTSVKKVTQHFSY